MRPVLPVQSTRSPRSADWLGTAYLLASLAWSVAVTASPWLLTHGTGGAIGSRAGVIVYAAGSVVCHQQPERSFHAWNRQLPVCARCTGLYLAAPAGAAVALVLRRRRRTRGGRGTGEGWRSGLMLAALPTMLTLGAEWTGLASVPAVARAAAALPLGFAVSWLVAGTLASLRDGAGTGAASPVGELGRRASTHEVDCSDASSGR